ncbi:unnamed protein product, partial [marine sediment metagenome]
MTEKNSFSINYQELLTALGARAVSDAPSEGELSFTAVCTDNREAVKNSIFFARTGEQTDGHRFIEAAVSSGATACIVSDSWANSADAKTLINKMPDTVFLAVKDTTIAFGDLARWWRQQLNVPVIAITGSNGKTTTKEMVRHALEQLVGAGTANEKSFNNHVGLPATILKASRSDKWLLLEAGMNHAGELRYLASIAKPSVAAVLNVGPVHLEYFSSLSVIADAKC